MKPLLGVLTMLCFATAALAQKPLSIPASAPIAETATTVKHIKKLGKRAARKKRGAQGNTS